MTRKHIQIRPYMAFLLLALSGAPASADPSGFTVDDPWVREGPPSARVLAGYMVLQNPSERPEAVVGASSRSFHNIEFHRTVLDSGVARMVEQERLQVPAGGRLALEPGGYHLMLMGAQHSLRAGDTVEIVLELDGGRQVTVKAPVRKAADTGHAHHHHH